MVIAVGMLLSGCSRVTSSTGSWGMAGQPGCCDLINKGKQAAASKIRHASEQQACLQAVKSVLQEAYGDKGAVTDELVQCILQPGLEVGCKMCSVNKAYCADGGWHHKSLVPQTLSCHTPQTASAAARGSDQNSGLTTCTGSHI